MNAPGNPLSVTAPVERAIEWTKVLLFRPFDLGRWCVIGFCAWLALLGQYTPGGGVNYRVSHNPHSWEHSLHAGWSYVVTNIGWLMPLVIIGFFVGLILWLLVLWVSSRGQFMFLHCVAGNRAEVVDPWHRFAAHGNSLFLFRVVLAVAVLVLVVPFALGLLALLGLAQAAGLPRFLFIGGLIFLPLFTVVFGVTLVVVGKLATDFVVPLMLLRGSDCWDAWRELLELIAARLGAFVLYLLFQIVLKIVIGVLILAVVLITCCLAGCLLAIPYIGTVVLLPILVFERAYSALFFAQLGTGYDVFQVYGP